MEFRLERILQSLLVQSPVLLVCLIGCVVSLLFLGRSKKAGWLAFSAFGTYIFARFCGSVGFEYIVSMQFEDGRNMKTISKYLGAVNIGVNLLSAVALVLLLLAAFAGRAPKRTLADEARDDIDG